MSDLSTGMPFLEKFEKGKKIKHDTYQLEETVSYIFKEIINHYYQIPSLYFMKIVPLSNNTYASKTINLKVGESIDYLYTNSIDTANLFHRHLWLILLLWQRIHNYIDNLLQYYSM